MSTKGCDFVNKLALDLLFSRDSLYNQRKQINLHYHKENELYLLLKGRVKYFIDNKTYIVNEGDLIIIPPGILHSTDTDDCLYNERLLISFGKDFFFSNISTSLQELFKEAIIHIPKENRSIIETMFYKIENEYNSKHDNKEIMLKLYITELLLYLHRYRTLNAQNEFSTDKIIQKIKQYINLNFEREISLNELSVEFGLTKSYLSKRFKSAVGTGINEYINYVRIEHAEKLLTTEKLSITEVATRCGFNDSSYFATVFKKLKGVTPYKFSKNHANK